MDELIDAFPGAVTPEGDGPIIDEGSAPEPSPTERLMMLAQQTGDLSGAIGLDDLSRIGIEVCEDYEKDKTDRKDWADIASEALKLAAQEYTDEEPSYPWKGCSNVRFPLLTTAALQFNARAYPAIVKGDEAISVKVVGQDRGRPQTGPSGLPMVSVQGQPIEVTPEVQQALQAQQIQPEPMWAVPPGGKALRAHRVADYLNTVLFYRMEDWEADTDVLLIQLPVVGCVFRKLWFDVETGMQRAAMVPALRIYVPEGARSVETTPRLTEEIPDVFPHEIHAKQRIGYYRDIILEDESDEKAGARLLLEQHRMMDLDEDGLEEPYIVTVDHLTQRVLRLEANFGPDDVKYGQDGRVVRIERGRFYVKYDFFPHPEGKFYGIGLGHLLSQLGDVVDTAINQLIDAGTAQTAGGGFVASGVNLQRKGSVIRFAPGEYKTVDGVSGSALRDSIVERTLPNVSPVTFQVLELILGAARDISGVKDVITGDASNTGQVGTTLALIEQGLQVFNAVYKRVYRALKEEYTLIYRNVSRFGGEAAAKDYAEVMDDPSADFESDFNMRDMDIRPVSDPSSVTRLQKMARAQFLVGTVQIPGANPAAILKRVYEAADVENPDELILQPQAPQPSPGDIADARAKESKSMLDRAKTEQTTVETEAMKVDSAARAFATGHMMGMAA